MPKKKNPDLLNSDPAAIVSDNPPLDLDPTRNPQLAIYLWGKLVSTIEEQM
jgi:hypothetical protein